MARHTLLPALLAILVGASPAHAWTWPADGPVLQRFTLGDNPYVAGLHRGIDVAGLAGTPVRAPAAGTVSFAGTVPHHGRTVTIRTPDGYAVTLVHLGGVAVSRSSPVAEGAVVGTIGPTGDAEHSVPYVHLGVRVAAEREGYVDPLLLLPPRELPPGASPQEGGATSHQGVGEPLKAGAGGAEATTGGAEAPGAAEAAADARGGAEMTPERPAEAEIPLPEAAEAVTSGAAKASAETAVATEQADGTAAAVSAEDTAADTRTVAAEATADERATEVPRAGAAEQQAPAAADAAGDRAAEAAGEAAVEAPSNAGAAAAVGETPSESSSDPANETPSPLGFDAPVGGGANTAVGAAPAEAVGDGGSEHAGDRGASKGTGATLGDDRPDTPTEVPAPLRADAPVVVAPSSSGDVPATVSGASAASAGPLPAAAREGSVGPPSRAVDGERGKRATLGARVKPGGPTVRRDAGRDAADGAKSRTVAADERAVGEPSAATAEEREAGARDRRDDADGGWATPSIASGVLVLAVVLLAALAFLGPSRVRVHRQVRVPPRRRAPAARRGGDRLGAPVRGSDLPLERRDRLAPGDVRIGAVERENDRNDGTAKSFVTFKAGMPLEALAGPVDRDGGVPEPAPGLHEACLRGGGRSLRETTAACLTEGRRHGAACRRSADVTIDHSPHRPAGCTRQAAQRRRRVLGLTRWTSRRRSLGASGRRAGGRLDAARASTERRT